MSDISTDHQSTASSQSAASEFDEFIYVLSHDLRASIRALVEVPRWIGEDLESEGHGVSDTMQDNLSLMDTHAKRLDQMLIDLVTYSRVGRLQDIAEISLAEALDQALEGSPLPDGFTLDTDFRVDRVRMGTKDCVVLMGVFLSNVIKHHDQKSGHIGIGTKQYNTNLILSIEDDGPGIPENLQDRVFDVMATLRPRDEVEGSGMGLALAKKIASHYGGDVRLVSHQTPRGCKFLVTLPMISTLV